METYQNFKEIYSWVKSIVLGKLIRYQYAELFGNYKSPWGEAKWGEILYDMIKIV